NPTANTGQPKSVGAAGPSRESHGFSPGSAFIVAGSRTLVTHYSPRPRTAQGSEHSNPHVAQVPLRVARRVREHTHPTPGRMPPSTTALHAAVDASPVFRTGDM